MSGRVPLYELEKAKKIKSLTDRVLMLAGHAGKVGIVLIGLGTVGMMITLIWSYSMVLGIITLLTVVVLAIIAGATFLNDKAKTTIRHARDYGVVDE